MITTERGVYVQDATGDYHYLWDYKTGGTALQGAEDAIANKPEGKTAWFLLRGRRAQVPEPEHAIESGVNRDQAWDLFIGWSAEHVERNTLILQTTFSPEPSTGTS